MFHRILIPLDGSTHAEKALPIAVRIAKATGSILTLLQISSLGIEYGPYFTRVGYLSDRVTKAELAQAQTYLENILQMPLLADIEVHVVAISGLPVSTILAYTQSQQIDLIVLCSHGYTGMKRWALGSVAGSIARRSPVPVLITREHSLLSNQLFPNEPSSIHALVALDGSATAEAMLTPAAHIIAALSQPAQGVLHLLQMVKLLTPEEELDYKRSRLSMYVRKQAISAAGEYLQTVSDRLMRELVPELGLSVIWTVEECVDVADKLIDVAEHGTGMTQACHLLALATHGRCGVQRLFLGSVAEHVLMRAYLPLLIVRPPQ